MNITACPAGNCTTWPPAFTDTGLESSYSGSAAVARNINEETAIPHASARASKVEEMIFFIFPVNPARFRGGKTRLFKPMPGGMINYISG